MDLGATLSLAGPTVVALLAATPREDPAQDDLRLVIIGLLALAAVLSVLTVAFWRATRPAADAAPARRSSRGDDEVTVRAVPAPTPTGAAVDPAPWSAPAAAVSAPLPSAPSPARTPVGSPDAPWPPPRVPRVGSARPARPPDDPDSLFGRLAALPDLDPAPAPLARSAASPVPQEPPSVPEESSSGRPTRSTSRS